MNDLALPGLLARDDDTPVLYEALGITLHLEKMVAEDAERLDAVNALVLDWLGPHLRQTWASFLGGVSPFEAGHLDYVSGQLGYLRDVATSAFKGHALSRLNEFAVYANGADDPRAAHPISYRFWLESPKADTYGVLQLTVPVDWPPSELEQRAAAIVGALRLRWGNVGYTYSTWEVTSIEISAARLAAHAKRYVGFDVGFFEGEAEAFYRRLRSINWLTLLGPSLEAEWRASGPAIECERVGENALFRATDAPRRGDANRLDYPRGYQRLDAALRRVRATDPGTHWLGPWEPSEQRDWLNRFAKVTPGGS